MNFTDKQKQVIEARNCNLLVSAAAGSGKTAVLVERILQRIVDEEKPLDVDKLLVVTFTRAAASELRERIAKRIDEEIDARSQDDIVCENLQRQSALLAHANICTIDSFCQTILRNYFREADIDPGFRIADEYEVKLMVQDVIEELLEEKFAEKEEIFLLTDKIFGGHKGALEEVIIDIYNFSLSAPFPDIFYENCGANYILADGDDIQKLPIFDAVKHILFSRLKVHKKRLERAISICEENDGPAKYEPLVEKEYDFVNSCLEETDLWAIRRLFEERLSDKTRAPQIRESDGVDPSLKKAVSDIRSSCKKDWESINKQLFAISKDEIINRIKLCKPIVDELISLAQQLGQRIWEEKRDKNILDFSDIEHSVLALLVDKKTNQPTLLARELRENFDEIMIDEYQDSNDIQELILSSISGEEDGNYNRFMVGDVKQSIYRFRMAKPAIFLEKYEKYTNCYSPNFKVELDQNFRSRKEVLDAVNAIFRVVMHKELGGIEYDHNAELKFGAENYTKADEIANTSAGDNIAELMIVSNDENAEEKLDKLVLEARAVAKRIKELVGTYQVTEVQREPDGTEQLIKRPCSYKDIVILYRSGAEFCDVYKRILEEEDIPSFVTSREGYFESAEIRTVMGFLRVLDNPREDISLYGAMISPFGNFTETEIASIKCRRDVNLYDSIIAALSDESIASELVQKLGDFLNQIDRYRSMVAYVPIHELIEIILTESGYLEIAEVMKSGAKRHSNLLALIEKARNYEKTCYHGLFHFMRYIDNLSKYEIDYGQNELADEKADLVRIMTIHKSKGLEFPVCFVCGLGKQFNTQDDKKRIRCNMNYGIAMNYYEVDKRVQYDSLHKYVISKLEHEELLAEELRILYVALTRAKEKLIMSGFSAENSKSVDVVEDAKCLLDYIMIAVNEGIPSNVLNVSYVNENDLRFAEVKEGLNLLERKNKLVAIKNRADIDEIAGRFKSQISFDYSGKALEGLVSKVSVSDLKHEAIEKLLEEDNEDRERVETPFAETDKREYTPTFIRQEEKGGTMRGNAFHRIMEIMDFNLEMDGGTEAIDKFIEKQIQRGRLSPEYAGLINRKKIKTFLGSNAGNRMRAAYNAGKLKREQPFVLGIPANEVRESYPAEETVLIQGIIDAFFEEEGEIVLLDYKTDAIKSGDELANRYKKQMELYVQALERLTHMKVKEVILYSFSLEKEVILEV
ncbi:MAG: helicase-exonuclease AddAB subunit AddA [Lachnospiraceae bacterium]|nr:helicase-exonuclease AddAB subunit AddA [Candidatus Merdinaster equi]